MNRKILNDERVVTLAVLTTIVVLTKVALKVRDQKNYDKGYDMGAAVGYGQGCIDGVRASGQNVSH